MHSIIGVGPPLQDFSGAPILKILRGWTHPSFDNRGLAPAAPPWLRHWQRVCLHPVLFQSAERYCGDLTIWGDLHGQCTHRYLRTSSNRSIHLYTVVLEGHSSPYNMRISSRNSLRDFPCSYKKHMVFRLLVLDFLTSENLPMVIQLYYRIATASYA